MMPPLPLRLALTFCAAFAAAAQAAPRLTVTPAAHDFGTVTQGETVQLPLDVTNPGDAPLELTAVQPTCGCTTTSDWPRRLEPGQSGRIVVKLDTTQFSGDIVKSVILRSNDPENPSQTVSMKAKVWTPITLSSAVLVLPAIANPDVAAKGSMRIENQLETPLTLSDVRSDQPSITASLREIAAGKTFELTATSVPPLKETTIRATVTVKTSNPKMPQLTIPVVASVLPPLQIVPTQLSIPSGTLSKAERRMVVIVNHRGTDLAVTDLATDAPGVDLALNVSADRKQHTVVLTFPAGFTTKANARHTVSGKTNTPAAPTFSIPIVASGP